jgi:hypothetical protein
MRLFPGFGAIFGAVRLFRIGFVADPLQGQLAAFVVQVLEPVEAGAAVSRDLARFARNGRPTGYLSSQTSSMRHPLKRLLTMIVSPLSCGCQQVANRLW